MDLSRIRTNRGAVVSIHFGRDIITTNIWWNYGWYVITDSTIIEHLKDIKKHERLCDYDRVEYLVNMLREDYHPDDIGRPYRRDRESHSNLGRRTRRLGGAPASNAVAARLIIDSFNENKLNGDDLNYDNVLQINEMKNQTFGMEVEMSNISRETACKTVAQFFGTEANYEPSYGHSAWMCRDAQGRAWLFETDGSLYGNQTCEMVTPILNYSDIETLQAVIRKLRQAGAKSSARYCCGIHVHVGAQGMTPQHLKNLAIIMFNFEHVLDKAIGVTESRHSYCGFMNTSFINRLMSTPMDESEQLTSRSQVNRSDAFTRFANVWYGSQHESRGNHYNSTRYHITNFHSVFDHGTVEFRLFEFKEPDAERQNGLHAGEAKAFIQMSLALMALAKHIGKIDGVDDTTADNKTKMLAYLDKLCMCGSDFATAREYYTRRLTD